MLFDLQSHPAWTLWPDVMELKPILQGTQWCKYECFLKWLMYGLMKNYTASVTGTRTETGTTTTALCISCTRIKYIYHISVIAPSEEILRSWSKPLYDEGWGSKLPFVNSSSNICILIIHRHGYTSSILIFTFL